MKALQFFKKHILIIILFISLFSFNLYSQGGYGAPFLTVSPSALINGMGGAGVAFGDAGDAFSFYHNPALLGYYGQNNQICAGLYPEKVDFVPGLFSSIPYNCFSLFGGYNLGKSDKSLPLSIGVGYIYQNVDLGEFTRTTEDGRVLGRFESFESAHNFAVGAKLDYWIKIGFGITYRYIYSSLSPVDSGNKKFEAGANAFDFGLLIKFPFVNSFEITDKLKGNFDISLGLALTNLGDELDYENESDPLPLASKIGYSASAGLDYNFLNTDYEAIKLDWTVECEDNLVNRDTMGTHFQSMFEDVNFADNFILMKEGQGINVKYGFRVSLFDIFQFYFGNNNESSYNEYKTNGYSVRAKGFLKLANSMLDSKILNYASEHIDVIYWYGKVKTSNDNGYLNKGRETTVIGLNYRFN